MAQKVGYYQSHFGFYHIFITFSHFLAGRLGMTAGRCFFLKYYNHYKKIIFWNGEPHSAGTKTQNIGELCLSDIYHSFLCIF